MSPEPLWPSAMESISRREQILSCTMDLVTNGGLAGLTEQAVAIGAQAAPSTISFYFGDFSTLMVETIRELRFRRHERYGRMLANLPAVGSDVADWNASARDVAAGLVWIGAGAAYSLWEVLNQAARIPELAAEARFTLDQLQESVGQLMVAAGVPRGELLGRPLVALEAGLLAHHRILGGSEEDLIDDLSHGLLSMINGHQALVAGAIPGA